MFNQIFDKISNLVKRAFITQVVNDSSDYQSTQVSYLGKVSNAQMIYPYGYNAVPPTNTMVLLFNVLGQEENLAGIPYAVSERFKNLKGGEVVLGSPSTGSYIKFKEDGSIEMYAKNGIKIFTDDGDIDVNAKNNLNMNSLTNDINFNSAKGIGWTATTDSLMTSTGNFTVTATTYTVNGQTNLGTGGARIARLGDQVTVGINTGTITSAGNNTSV